METGENMKIDEMSLDQLPNEILMKVMDYLELPNKLNLSLVSRRFLDIFSNFHFAKNLQWRIDGYIHPDIAPFNAYTTINSDRFLNIKIGFVEAVDEETHIEFFRKVGRYTTSLKLKTKGPKPLFSCFPVLESLEMDDIQDLTHYNEIPINLKSINLTEVDALVGQEVLEKLEHMKNLITVDYAALYKCFRRYLKDNVPDDSELFIDLTNDLNSFRHDACYARVLVSKSLFNTTIELLDITKLDLDLSTEYDSPDMIPILKCLKNLEEFSLRRDGYEEIICFQIHDVQWEKLKSLTLNLEHCDECQLLCENCMNTIKHNFPLLNKLILLLVMTHQQLDEVAQCHPSITEIEIDLTEDSRGTKLSVLKHFHHLKKLTVIAGTDFSIIAFDNCPLLPDLEEFHVETLDLIPKKTDLDCCCDESEDNPDPNCPYCGYDPKNYIPTHWNESVSHTLALKFPKLKKFECFIDNAFLADILAMLIYWPELQYLTFYAYNSSQLLEYSDFAEFLQELKELKWKLPPLKVFNLFIAEIDNEDSFKLFEIFPTLKSICLKETMTVADFEKKEVPFEINLL